MREKLQRIKSAYFSPTPFVLGVWIYTFVIGGLIIGITLADYFANKHYAIWVK